MFETLRRKLSEWLEDTTHWLRTGESTIRCYNDGDHRKVYLHPTGYSRVNITEVLRSKKVQKELDALARIAKYEGKNK